MGRKFRIARDKADGSREYRVTSSDGERQHTGKGAKAYSQWVITKPAIYSDSPTDCYGGEFDEDGGWFEIHMEPGEYLVPLVPKGVARRPPKDDPTVYADLAKLRAERDALAIDYRKVHEFNGLLAQEAHELKAELAKKRRDDLDASGRWAEAFSEGVAKARAEAYERVARLLDAEGLPHTSAAIRALAAGEGST